MFFRAYFNIQFIIVEKPTQKTKSSPAFKQECGGGKLLSYIVFTENGKAKDEGKILLLEVSRNGNFAVLPCRYHNA